MYGDDDDWDWIVVSGYPKDKNNCIVPGYTHNPTHIVHIQYSEECPLGQYRIVP